MKKNKIFWGICFLALAVLLILDAFHVFDSFTQKIGKVSVWAILGIVALVLIIIDRIIKCKFFHIFIPFALLFMLVEHNIARFCGFENPNLINNWILLLIAVLLTIGFRLIFSRQHLKNKKHSCLTSGHSCIYVNSADFTPDFLENNLGSLLVYFENTEAYLGNGTIHVENNLGSMIIHLPNAWCAKVLVKNSIGAVDVQKKDSGIPITIKGENNLGSIKIVYV